jgi:hypothetical protein
MATKFLPISSAAVASISQFIPGFSEASPEEMVRMLVVRGLGHEAARWLDSDMSGIAKLSLSGTGGTGENLVDWFLSLGENKKHVM